MKTVDELNLSEYEKTAGERKEKGIKWIEGQKCPDCGDRVFEDAGRVWCRSALYMEGPCPPVTLRPTSITRPKKA